jgi:hypothetical protein
MRFFLEILLKRIMFGCLMLTSFAVWISMRRLSLNNGDGLRRNRLVLSGVDFNFAGATIMYMNSKINDENLL